MNKFELWRQRRRERYAAEAAVPEDAPSADADAEALPADANGKGVGAEHGADCEDTVPAAFYRNIG